MTNLHLSKFNANVHHKWTFAAANANAGSTESG